MIIIVINLFYQNNTDKGFFERKHNIARTLRDCKRGSFDCMSNLIVIKLKKKKLILEGFWSENSTNCIFT